MTEDRDKWRKYIHGVANLFKDGYKTEQDSKIGHFRDVVSG